MWTALLLVLMIILIVLEKTKKINLSNMGGAVFLIVASSVCVGLYVFEFIKVILSVIMNVMDLGDSFAAEYSVPYSGESVTKLVIESLVLFVVFVPLVVCFVFILVKLVRKPLENAANWDTQTYSARCGIRSATLGAAASVLTTVMIVISALLTIPYWENLSESLVLLNPLILLFVLVFTGGLGLPFLAGFFILMNGAMAVIVSTGLFICGALYIYSLVLGIASCVRAAKIKAAATAVSVAAGIFMTAVVWNVIPLIYIRNTLKKHIEDQGQVVFTDADN